MPPVGYGCRLGWQPVPAAPRSALPRRIRCKMPVPAEPPPAVLPAWWWGALRVSPALPCSRKAAHRPVPAAGRLGRSNCPAPVRQWFSAPVPRTSSADSAACRRSLSGCRSFPARSAGSRRGGGIPASLPQNRTGNGKFCPAYRHRRFRSVPVPPPPASAAMPVGGCWCRRSRGRCRPAGAPTAGRCGGSAPPALQWKWNPDVPRIVVRKSRSWYPLPYRVCGFSCKIAGDNAAPPFRGKLHP